MKDLKQGVEVSADYCFEDCKAWCSLCEQEVDWRTDFCKRTKGRGLPGPHVFVMKLNYPSLTKKEMEKERAIMQLKNKKEL